MRQFINDMIHMAEGERLLYYWWLWLAMIGLCFLGAWIVEKAKKSKRKDKCYV
jgi:ABC-type polysaccharide/polyol phosphate export permease